MRKLEQAGTLGGRVQDAKAAKGSLSKWKARPDYVENKSFQDSVLMAIGVKVPRKKEVSKDSLISGVGRPVRAFDNEFTRLREKVYKQESIMEGVIGKGIQHGTTFMNLGGNLGPDMLVNLALQGVTRVPVVGWVAGIAVTAMAGIWEAYLRQFQLGGTRDVSKGVKASDVSIVGVEYENMIHSGEVVFFSNPAKLQGLPEGPSNTSFIMTGISRHRQRHQGSY